MDKTAHYLAKMTQAPLAADLPQAWEYCVHDGKKPHCALQVPPQTTPSASPA